MLFNRVAVVGALALLAVPLLFSQTAPQGPSKPEDLCSVEGTVTNAMTAEPLKKVSVDFQGTRTATSGQKVPFWYNTTTDEAGKYAAVRIEPGSYMINVFRLGFLGMSYGAPAPLQDGPPVTLVPGCALTGIDFKMTPQGVITGSVMDADGEPLRNVVVYAMPPMYFHGKRSLAGGARTGRTDDRGRFRMANLAAGSYYLVAAPPGLPAGEDRSANPRQEGYIPTFYPGVAESSGAIAVEVAAGRDTQGASFKLARRPVVSVRGRVVNQTGVAGMPWQVSLMPFGPLRAMYRGLDLGPSGQFEMPKVWPGSYALVALMVNGERVYRAAQPLEVQGKNVENIVLTLTAGFDLPGIVSVEEGGSVHPGGIEVHVVSTTSPSVTQYAVPDSNGAFKETNVAPDRYMLDVRNLPEGYFVKSARMGDANVLEDGADLRSGPSAPLQILVSAKGGAISGTVRGDDDSPLFRAVVALVPEDAKRRAEDRWYGSAETDQSGRFKLSGLPPGDYKMFAWARVEAGAWTDPEFLRPVESKGKQVTVPEGGSQQMNLQALPPQE